MTAHKLGLLQTAVSNLIIIPHPGRALVNNEVHEWFAKHGIVFPQMFLNEKATGFNQNGTNAIIELTTILQKERSDYQRGTNFNRLGGQVAKVVITTFVARLDTAITLDDVALIEKIVEDKFLEQTIPRIFYIPCSLIPEHATAFTIGPVTFFSKIDLINREQINSENPEADLTYGYLLRTMRDRSACWLAEVKIDGFDEILASERADLAVDVALVAIQMSIPVNYSRKMARITGRTMPSWMGSVYKSGHNVHSGSHRRDPGLGFSAGVFDQFRSQQQPLLESVGKRVNAYISGNAKMANLDQAWSDAAYWFHEGLAEPIDTIAVAKLETSIEVLLSAENSRRSAQRLREAFQSFYCLSKDQPIGEGSPRTVDQFIKSIVGARSRILHGTMSTLTPDILTTGDHGGRDVVELLAMDLLRRFTLMLDDYEILPDAKDNVTSFLNWITQRPK